MQPRGAPVDFGTRNTPHVRHGRINLKGRLLLGHGYYRTQVFSAQRNFLRSKRSLDIRRPGLSIRDSGRYQPHDLRARLFGAQFRFLNTLGAATGQHQQPDAQHERFA